MTNFNMIARIFIVAAVCLVQCSHQTALRRNADVPSSPAIPPTQAPLEEDDFVPYNRSRHTEFDFKLVKSVLAGQETSNVILSPFSVKLLMSLLAEAAGAGTVTEDELAKVLPGVNNNLQAREFYKHVLQSLQEPSKDYTFKIATKIYVNPLIKPRQRFASIAELYYTTNIAEVDFREPSTCPAINHWVAEATHNRITELVQPTDLQDAVMIMLNAIYFNSDWRSPFPANETIEAPFFVRGSADKPLRTTFMQQTGTFFYVDFQPLDAKVLRLPYKGRRFSMTLLLPNNASAPIDALLARLDADALRSAQYYMDEVEVRMQIPKFRFDHSAPLNAVLQSLGIRSIFTAEASLPLLARGVDAHGRLQVSKVLQKAGIEVNERGSTAYAATEVVLANRFGGDTTPEFVANRPFVFLIEDESTGSLLFAGKVSNPAEFLASA